MTELRQGRRIIASVALLVMVSTAAVGQEGSVGSSPTGPACRAGTLFLALETGTMAAADHIAEVMRAEHVRATFFLADEVSYQGGHALDERWAGYWRERVAEGHTFGNHTWSHAVVRKDLADGRVLAAMPDGKSLTFDQRSYCEQLTQVDERFFALTNRHLTAMWRAPAGRTTPRTLAWASSCGYPRHVGWTDASLLGDELPAGQYPNELLLARALRDARDGDILMMHLGIRSRRPPLAAVFRPLLAGLKARGFCFATLKPESPIAGRAAE
jgi:peptidoglycan/xylan/chitin deacetylase (PgdA/CDA1 family)